MVQNKITRSGNKNKLHTKHRILVFCPWAYSNSYYTAQFCNAASSENLEIFLIAPDNFMTTLLSKRINLIRWPYQAPEKTSLYSLLQTPGQLLRFITIANHIRPTWIHLLWKHHLPILLKWYLKEIPVAFTVHDPELHSGEAGRIRQWIQNQLINLSSLYFVHGEKTREILFQHPGVQCDKIHIIPMGTALFWNQEKIRPQEKLILFFGRIRRYKGLSILLKAFEQVSRHLPDYRLAIHGHGNPDDIPEKIHSMPNVLFENRYIHHEEIPELFSKACFIVLPYLDGTQSGVVPMAFHFGRTCIASAVGDFPAMIKHGKNGLLVEPGNTGALAEAIVKLANDNILRKSLEKGALAANDQICRKHSKTLPDILAQAYSE